MDGNADLHGMLDMATSKSNMWKHYYIVGELNAQRITCTLL